MVDVLLGPIRQIVVDQKLHDIDCFDDLATIDAHGIREGIQVKYKDRSNSPLGLSEFTGGQSRLALDKLIRSAAKDRRLPSEESEYRSYRVFSNHSAPVDPELNKRLRPADPDPGPLFPSLATVRFRFESEGLWPQQTVGRSGQGDPFTFLKQGPRAIDRADLDWLCERLVVEVQGPSSSGDLARPDGLESLLLSRLASEVGVGRYPNTNRTVEDFAQRMVSVARNARQGRSQITKVDLVQRTQLRTDFGSVANAHPVARAEDRAVEVRRDSMVGRLTDQLHEAKSTRKAVIVTGPPGHGKSWACRQVVDALKRKDWIVAEHYCFLGETDRDRDVRVQAESVFGSILKRLAEQVPECFYDQRPRFAADEATVHKGIRKVVGRNPTRPVAIVIDGIDHVARVREGLRGKDPSLALIEVLCQLDLPAGSVLVVVSQPGSHLSPLEQAGAMQLSLPGLEEHELRQLASRYGVIRGEANGEARGDAQVVDESQIDDFLQALSERSLGNALYATYLCKEALRCPSTIVGPADTVRSLPVFDATLESYYRYLLEPLENDGAGPIADVLALIDFPVLRTDLKEICPSISHRVDSALDTLAPVLLELSTQGGVRIYHESFARYLRQQFADCKDAHTALANQVIDWLMQQDVTRDARAFRSLLPMLHEVGRHKDVIRLVGTDFVALSVAGGFQERAILTNLRVAVLSAAKLGDWPAVARYNELARASRTYDFETLETTLDRSSDIILEVLGVDAVTELLLQDGRPVMEGSKGLRLCAAIDEFGGVPPWSEYLEAYQREQEVENEPLYRESETPIYTACLRGNLRLASIASGSWDWNDEATAQGTSGQPTGAAGDALDGSSVNWARVSEFAARHDLPGRAVVEAVFDTFGYQALRDLAAAMEDAADFCLAVAQAISEGRIDQSRCEAKMWAEHSVRDGYRSGTAQDLLDLGVDTGVLDAALAGTGATNLTALTLQVQDESITSTSGIVENWVDRCSIAAFLELPALRAAEIAITGTGWYRCWLRFVIGLCRARAASDDERSVRALEALRLLTGDLSPFEGDPRSCDLYPIHGVIYQTIRSAVRMLDDEAWPEGVRLLHDVSDRISTSIQGELGGPLPPRRLLELIVDTAGPSRYDEAESHVFGEIENGSGHRYYSDLAEYQLIAARLAIAAGNEPATRKRWVDACGLLTAYGIRKDMTIFGLLHPATALISADAASARARVAQLQSLCLRVVRHTDGKETYYCWPRWWAILAKLDPSAHASLVAARLLSECNDPNDVFDESRKEVWQHWHDRADPLVAGALRLSLPDALTESDPEALRNLANTTRDSEVGADSPLARLLLARADERPFEYVFTNSQELVNNDSCGVSKLNTIASASNLPTVNPFPKVTRRTGSSIDPSRETTHPSSSVGKSSPRSSIRPQFPQGSVGIAKAVRAWNTEPLSSTDSPWTVDFTANLLGYRLLEIVDAGNTEEAITSLQTIADADRFGSQVETLKAIARGLERFGHTELAARAFTMCWTRTQGVDWGIFGGEKEITALARALELDRSTALEVVAQDAARFVGAHGIGEALIHTSIELNLSDSHESGIRMAFRIWDAMHEVINQRAPRVHASDDPEDPYEPACNDDESSPHDLNVALATAAVAGIAHPGLEAKRRSFVATRLLLAKRPDVVAPSIRLALESLSDPATLTWLLQLLELHADTARRVIAACKEPLERLSMGPTLSVRTLARRLLGKNAGPELPPSSPVAELLRAGPSGLVMPANSVSSENDSAREDMLVEFVAGKRLERVESRLPGFRVAVRAKVAQTAAGKRYRSRKQAQSRALVDRSEQRMPDAFLVSFEAVEEAIQIVAAGGRAALAASGELLADPAGWEDEIAEMLLDDAELPLAIEATRQPRPSIPPPRGSADAIWTRLGSQAIKQSERPMTTAPLSKGREVIEGTVENQPSSTVPQVESGGFSGWRMIGTVEKSASERDRQTSSKELTIRYQGLECCPLGHVPPTDLLPFGSADIRNWSVKTSGPLSFPTRIANCRAVVGIDDGLHQRHHHCLGMPEYLLAPTRWLISTLHLKSGSPFVMEDSIGPALSLVTWRTQYDSGHHHLAWPRLVGTAVLIRNDLFDRLLAIPGAEFVFREYATRKIWSSS